jgi:SAM-dependent methyltransferase
MELEITRITPPSQRPCPICTAAPEFGFKGIHLYALKCGNEDCGHVYAAAPTPMRGVQQHFDPEGECRQFRVRNLALVRFLRRKRFLRPGSRILDVGAGAGHVAMAIRDAMPTVDITCVELDPTAKAWLETKDFNVFDSVDNVRGNFDSIYLIEVIEHVDDPVQVLKTLRGILPPNGQLFMTTPCGQTKSGRFLRHAFETPEHVHFFTRKSLARALAAAGFVEPRFRTLRYMYMLDRSRRARTLVRDVARYMRARMLGHHHLITFVGSGRQRSDEQASP